MAEIDLQPQIVDLKLYAGDGVNIRLTVTDNEDPPGPINLTGTVEAQIRTSFGSADPPSATFTVDLTEAVDGIVLLSLTRDQTQDLATIKKFKGVWDVQWVPTEEYPRTLFHGKAEVMPDVTH